jgi:hypothetical protein
MKWISVTLLARQDKYIIMSLSFFSNFEQFTVILLRNYGYEFDLTKSYQFFRKKPFVIFESKFLKMLSKT